MQAVNDSGPVSSEERYRRLMAALPVALWHVDARTSGTEFQKLKAEGVTDLAAHLQTHPELVEWAKDAVLVTDANAAAVALFGGSDATQLVRPVRYMFEGTPAAAGRVMCARFEGKRNYIEEMKIATFDGRTVDVLCLVTYPQPPEQLDATLIMMLDISQRLQTEARLRQLEADFVHAARISTLGELAASIAHEVRQPLTAIATSADAIRRFLDLTPINIEKVKEIASRIISSARHATDVIERIRGMAAKREPVSRPLDLNDVVEEALALVRYDSRQKSVELAVHLQPDLPTINGDRVHLQQVVVNLLVNGIQAIAGHDAHMRLIHVTTCTGAPGEVRCTIRDSGPGIAPENLGRVFAGFFTTKTEGMGMGLTICRSIVATHGGTIVATNHPEGGAQVSFSLPVGDRGGHGVIG